MNHPWRGGLLLALLLIQEPKPDLVATYSSVLTAGPETRRDLAARALLSLGRPGYEALRRTLDANPELAKGLRPLPDRPPATALVRIGTNEAELWRTLDSPDRDASTRAARRLRELYSAPPPAPPGRPSDALREALDRPRDFDLTDRSLAAFLADEPISWILMSPRDERITLRLRGAALRDLFRIAMPKFAAVPVGDLLLLIPHDRVAAAEPADAVWAPADLAPRIEVALNALARGDEGPINGLTGVGVYHALIRAGHAARAAEVRRQLEQRIYFIDAAADEGKPVTLAPAGTVREAVQAFERASGLRLPVDAARFDGSPPAFRFRGIPAPLAARALAFRLNRIY